MARWRTILVSSCIGLLGCGQFLIMVYPFFALAESSGAPANTFDLSIESMAIVILDANNLPSPAALEDRKTALSLEVEPRSESVRNFDYLAIIEIRDNNGVTTYLSWKQGHILDGAHQNITFSWTPASSGSYEARAFAIRSFQMPEILSQITSSYLKIVQSEEELQELTREKEKRVGNTVKPSHKMNQQ